MGWKIHKMDVKKTFLNRVIEEEVFIEKLKVFETLDRESHAFILKRVVYGLKEALSA